MASNGTYIRGEYFNAGSNTWSALTSGWSAFTDWSSNPTQLQYTKVFDFGVAKPVIPTVILTVPEGSAYLTITYGSALDGGTGEVTGGTTMGADLYYDLDRTMLCEKILQPGDCSITLHGGHNYLCLEDDTVIYEFKTGPYNGRDKDKEYID